MIDPSPGAPPGYRRGLISAVRAKLATGDTVVVGDLVALDGDTVRTWAFMDAKPGPTTFFDTWLGAVWSDSLGVPPPAGEVVVYVMGQCWFPLDMPATAYHPVGTFVTAVANQTVKIDTTANASTMIGKVAVPVEPGDTGCLFELRSRVMS